MDATGPPGPTEDVASSRLSKPLEIRIAGGSVLVFDSIIDLRKWLEQEQDFWSWLEKFSRTHHSLNELWNRPANAWNRAHELISQYESGDVGQKSKALPRIEAELSIPYSDDLWALPSSSPRAQYIKLLKSSNAQMAAFALLAFLKPSNIISGIRESPDALQGVLHAFLFDHGMASNGASAIQDALKKATDSWGEVLAQARTDNANWHNQFTKHDETTKALIAEHEGRFKTQLDSVDQELKRIRRVYEEELALLAPVEYWTKKAKVHLISSALFALVSIASGVAIAYLGWQMVAGLLIFHPDQVPAGFDPKTEFWRYGVVIAAGTLMVWPLRILVRLLMSHLHLRSDAMERVTMAKTYLSLVRSKEGLSESDRRLILETLFRPSATGLVHDDAAPTSAVYLLSRLLSGDKKLNAH